MKKFIFPLMAAAVVALAGACSSTGGKSTDPVLEAAVKAKIESRDYTIDVDRMIPTKGRTVSLTWPYSVTIKGDSINSYLPYFGEAYSAVIGRQDGLNFEGTVYNYKTSITKKGDTKIEFSAHTFEDRYNYDITVYPNGAATVHVSPDRKSSVSFDGKLKMDDKE